MIRHGFGWSARSAARSRLPAAVLADYGTGPDGIGQAVRYTARWSFLFFWLSYAGGAMAILFGPAFAGLARQARTLGLAFATALQVHIGLVVWLGVVIGQIPLQGGLLWFFLVALFCSLSAGAAVLRSRNAQPGTSVAATALPGHDLHSDRLRPGFCAGRTRPDEPDWRYAAEYLPFALLSLIAIPLRLAAFLRRRFGLRSAELAAELDREPVKCH